MAVTLDPRTKWRGPDGQGGTGTDWDSQSPERDAAERGIETRSGQVWISGPEISIMGGV